MQDRWDTSRRFLLAAKQAEIDTLQQLAVNCRVVGLLREVIHQLQRERGSSNIFLCSQGKRFSELRDQVIRLTIAREEELRELLLSVYLEQTSRPGNMRLLSSITRALQNLDQLRALRDNIRGFKIAAVAATEAFNDIISSLLSVIFEAADIASDPAITRILVGLFNFLQGKEFSGQERAWGAIGFAAARFETEQLEQLEQLQRAQAHSFEIFTRFCTAEIQDSWHKLQNDEASTELGKLRRMIPGLTGGASIPDTLSEVWYDICTRRIDIMHTIEEALARQLEQLAGQRITQARKDLQGKQQRLEQLPPLSGNPLSPQTINSLQPTPEAREENTAMTGHLAFYDLLHEQAKYIERMTLELEEARRAIVDQKLIDRAKLILMQQFKLSEALAFRRLQKHAMDQNLRMVDVAERVIAAASPK